jgi:hypothetical protein
MISTFQLWHLRAARFKDEPAKLFARERGLAALERLVDAGLIETILTDDMETVLAFVGIVPKENGVGEVFVLATQDQDRYPVVFAKCVRASLDTIRKHFANIHAIGEDTPFFTRWFSWLGFSCEGPVSRPEFTPGKTMLLWSMGGRA